MIRILVWIAELLERLFGFASDGEILDDADERDCGPVMRYIKPADTRIGKGND